MEEYLSSSLEKLKSNDYANLTIVLGNESCDLDSAVSALVYATFLNWQYNQIKCKVCTKKHRDNTFKDDIFLPVLDVERADFPLKTEVAFCFKEHGITEDKLLFSDDIDLKTLVTASKTNIILVDHHILAKKYDFLIPYVTEIIDHRPLDTSEWKYKDDVRSTISVVGSCCTLVAQRIKDLEALMKKEAKFFDDYPVCADLLHSVILLDTVNFSKEVNKATPHDVEIVAFLECLLKPQHCEENRKCKVDRMVAARSDVSYLTAAQLLRKDSKILGDIIVPSFPILVKEFLRTPNALEAVSEALATRNCALAVLLGMELKGTLQRDAAIVSPSCQSRGEKLSRFLQQWSTPPLELIPEIEPQCFYFKQMNLSASRKQFMPALNEFLSDDKE